MAELTWVYYPRSKTVPDATKLILKAFQFSYNRIDSENHNLESNGVLAEIRQQLGESGFAVESGKQKLQKIKIPVLYGLNGKIEKSFEVDAFNPDTRVVLEVEAGRAVTNNQFLKDFFEACIMSEVDYLALAVRQVYKNGRNFEQVTKFFDSLYASNRLVLPLKGVLVIGY